MRLQSLGGKKCMTTTCGPLCGATGWPPTPMTLRRSTKSTELTQFSSIRNRASASAVEHNIQASRVAQPSTKRFTVRRMLGGGDLWISELVLTYDGQPFYVVSIMEFEGGGSGPRDAVLWRGVRAGAISRPNGSNEWIEKVWHDGITRVHLPWMRRHGSLRPRRDGSRMPMPCSVKLPRVTCFRRMTGGRDTNTCSGQVEECPRGSLQARRCRSTR